jgi:hypothetical protein
MTARAILMALAFLPLAAHSADDGRVRYLEQEVRNLQRQVGELSRRIDGLTRPALPPAGNSAREPRDESAVSNQWIDAGKWDQLRPGLGEVDVIRLLGPPTSMRDTADGRVLFYALEIGTAGFLGGSVTLRDHLVIAVQKPVLR